MSLIFYWAPNSTASITEAVLAELGIQCERVKLDIDAGDTRKADFVKLNPNGRVPTIVHGGIAIWESSAITMYLGEMFGVDAKLYPALGPKRGEAMKWIAWSNVTFAEAAGRLSAALPAGSPGAVQVGSVDWVPPDLRSAGAEVKAKADLANCLRILNDALADRPFLLGDYSLADTHVQGFVGWVGAMDIDLAPYPNVAAWLRRCGERLALTKLAAE